MASPPGIFYACAKNMEQEWHRRYIITFASRAIADEWWRMVTDSVANGYARFSHIQRQSIQFYTYDLGIANIVDSILDERCAKPLVTKMFFSMLSDRDAPIGTYPISVLSYTEHRNNERFFIRSMLQPNLFWFYDTASRQIIGSPSQRTRFRIQITDHHVDGTIMIWTDQISINVGPDLQVEASDDHSLVANENGRSQFKFGDFDGGFALGYEGGPAGRLPSIMAVTRNEGDKWELVL